MVCRVCDRSGARRGDGGRCFVMKPTGWDRAQALPLLLHAHVLGTLQSIFSHADIAAHS